MLHVLSLEAKIASLLLKVEANVQNILNGGDLSFVFKILWDDRDLGTAYILL